MPKLKTFKPKAAESVSKWESSFFGGFYQVIVDYPEIKMEFGVNFSFANIGFFSYYQKEKILKIFLSNVKKHGLIDRLFENCKTEKVEKFYGSFIKTSLSEESKSSVINMIAGKEPELAPLFKHYKKFIMDSEIYYEKWEQPKGKSSKPDDEQDENESKSGNEKSKEKENSSEKKEKDQSKDSKEKEEKVDNDSKSEKSEKSEKEKTEQEKKEEKDKSGDSKPEKEKEKTNEQEENQKSSNEVSEETKKEMSTKISKKEENSNIDDFKHSIKTIIEKVFKFDSISNFGRKTRSIIDNQRNTETNFTADEIMAAERLTKLLDISFDPAREVVKNLRLGKLDVSKIAEVPAGNISIYKQELEDQITKPFSVAILCDESGSMSHYGRIGPQYEVVKSLYLAFTNILPQNKIFVFGHSGSESPELYVYQDPHNPNFLTTIDNMLERNYSQNYDGPIIESVHSKIRSLTSDRIIFIILSDGEPSGEDYGSDKDRKKMKQIIEKCKRDDFVTVGIGIQHFSVQDLYQYSTVVSNLSEFPKKVSHIVNHVVKTEFQ